MSYQERLLRVIPGGAHTYSRGFDQYPQNAPQILARGEGAYVYDPDGNEYLDYGMALRAVNIGYANQEVNQAALRQMQNGNNLTRASLIELEAAELLVDLIPSIDMVKFTKNGSTATTAAIKLSRAFTGREMVARCRQHPFFSYDDWFIGSTPVTKGVLKREVENTRLFDYNDLASLSSLFDQFPNQIACVILEPAVTEHPKDNFLHGIKELCEKNGAVFILDEMITGFRWHLQGAQTYYNVMPDLCTFGKAMANGFSVAAVAGKREIMQLGSIEFHGTERVFFLSTTHGAEMCGLGAFVKTVELLRKHDVVSHIWNFGNRLVAMMNAKAKKLGIEKFFVAGGIDCSPVYFTYGLDGSISLPLRTLFAQEMLKNRVMIPWIALSYSHGEKEFSITENAVERSLEVYKQALENGVEKYLVGESVKPVFRKFN